MCDGDFSIKLSLIILTTIPGITLKYASNQRGKSGRTAPPYKLRLNEFIGNDWRTSICSHARLLTTKVKSIRRAPQPGVKKSGCGTAEF